MRRAGRVGIITLAVVAASLVLPSPAAANTVPSRCPAMNPFTPALENVLAFFYPGNRFSASVLDERTGCTFDLHPELRMTTASVAKVAIMAGVLLRAQSEGRSLTSSERSLIEPMITQSANEPASQLFSSLGGASGMEDLDDVWGMTDTAWSPVWGLTTTSARDQVRLLRQVLLGDFGPLAPSYRADAYNYMTSVVPDQRWGITAGVPSGWTVAQKNGFAPNQCCGWRINSTGVVYDPAGGSYVVAIFSDGWPTESAGIGGIETVSRAIAASLASSFTIPRYYLRDQLSSGIAERSFTYGAPADQPLVGDWDGDGVATAGIDRNGVFFLCNTPGGATADTTFGYGDFDDEVIVGDWDGDGTDTIGVHRGATFFLRNSNTSGVADKTFNYGDPGDQVVVGDWNGDGKDTIAIVRGTQWFIRNTNSTGVADVTFVYGDPGDTPLAGDWDGDGVDTPGIQRDGAYYLANTNAGGVADVAFAYGDPGDTPLAGDWDGDGVDSIGVVRTRP